MLSLELGDLGYAANTCVFQAAEHRRKQCSEHRSRQRSNVLSIEAGKEAMFRAKHRNRQVSRVTSKEDEDGAARNLGIWAMQPIHVCSELQR